MFLFVLSHVPVTMAVNTAANPKRTGSLLNSTMGMGHMVENENENEKENEATPPPPDPIALWMEVSEAHEDLVYVRGISKSNEVKYISLSLYVPLCVSVIFLN